MTMEPEVRFDLLRKELAVLTSRATEMNAKLGGLSGALESVAQLQSNQRKIEATAVKASTRVEEVAAHAATKDDVAELTRERRRALRQLYIALVIGTLAVLGIGLGGIAAATAYGDQQRVFQHAQYANCVSRNNAMAASKTFTAKLIEVEQHSLDQQTAAKLIAALRELQARQVPVDCTKLLKS